MSRSVSSVALVVLAVAACADPSTASRTTGPDAPRMEAGVDALVAIPLGDLGGGASTAYQLAESGPVVGSSRTAAGETHAFVWTPATGMRDLGTLPGDAYSEAYGVNRLGVVVGVSGSRAVRWDAAGRIAALPLPAEGTGGAARAVDDGGTVVGWVEMPSVFPFSTRHVPALWSLGADGGVRLVPLPSPLGGSRLLLEGEGVAIAGNGRIAATIGLDMAHGTFAATWQVDEGWRVPDLGVSVDTRAYDLNGRGDMVGVDLYQPSTPRPVRWRLDGTREVLAATGVARGINAAGQVVGNAAQQPSGPVAAVVWDGQGRMQPLADRGATLYAISEQGDIVGRSGAGIATLWTRRPSLAAGAGAVAP